MRPDENGACQLTTLLAQRVNIRLEPSVNADVVGLLSPDTLVDVLGITIVNGETWYRIADGWVSSGVVVVGGDCPVRVNRVSVGTGSLDPDPTADLVPNTHCTILPNDELVCYTILSAVPDDGANNGLVPQEKCVPLPSGDNFCYTVLLGVAPQADNDGGLVPQTECTTLLGGTPICFNIFVGDSTGVQGQTREHILLATATSGIAQQCTMLAGGEEFCYNTFITPLPDDGSTAGLSPQTQCVDTLEGTPACFTVLVANAPDDGSTDGLVPQTQCTELLGELICINNFTANADDGSTDGLMPQTECVDFLGETICINSLTANADDGSTDGLVPQTQCTEILGELVCIDTFVAAAPTDGSSAGLSPETQCTELLGELVCIDTFTANVDDEPSGYQWGVLSFGTPDDTQPPFNLISQLPNTPDDGSTAGLIPGMTCVDTPGGTPFCYPTLIAVAPDDGATNGLGVDVECTELLGDVVCINQLTAYIPDGDNASGLAPQTVCTELLGQIICYNSLLAIAPDSSNSSGGVMDISAVFALPNPSGDPVPMTNVDFSIPIPPEYTGAIAIPVFMPIYKAHDDNNTSTAQSLCMMFDIANIEFCP